MRGKATGLVRWLGLVLELKSPVTADDRRRVIETMFHEGDRARSYSWRFAVLMALSVCLATLGLTANSPAVIIGAMVVAPLMGPVLGIAASIVMGWPRRAWRQATLVVLAAVGAVGLAAVLSAFLPGDLQGAPSELLARTRPNALDLGVAIAAGAVGAYTIVRKEAAEAMAGAAIAVALVPPLATIGISFEQGRFDMAFGALLLVSANVVGVVFSGALTFLFGGFVPGMTLAIGGGQMLRGFRWVAVATVFMIVPLQWSGFGLLSPPPEGTDVGAVVEQWSSGSPSPVDVINVDVEVEDGVTNVDVVVAGDTEAPSVERLAEDLSAELDREVSVELQQLVGAKTQSSRKGD